MKYNDMKSGVFIKRPNRFTARAVVEGREEICHVKNTGRCRELLLEGAKVYVQHHDNPNRKTKYSLIGVKKGAVMVNIDSQAPNKVVGEWLEQRSLFPDAQLIRPETTYKNSRFDFYVETKTSKVMIEVKGVTLEEDGIARFPDAPTKRGVKHVKELIEAKKDGYEAYIIFVIQMKGCQVFEPNDQMHPEFGQALRKAQANGVHILAMDCLVTADSLVIDQPVTVNL